MICRCASGLDKASCYILDKSEETSRLFENAVLRASVVVAYLFLNLSIIFIIIIIIQLEGNSYRSPLLPLTKQLDLGRCKLNLLGKSKLAVMPEMLNRNWLSRRIQMTWRLTRIKHQHP